MASPCPVSSSPVAAAPLRRRSSWQVHVLRLPPPSSFVTDELAELLQAYPSGAGKLLRLLCAERLEKMDEKSKELKISTSTNHASHASRVLRSEYLCLRLHVQILDELAGQPSETSTSAQDLKHELQLLHQARRPAVERHQRRLERFRSRVEELLASPSVELLEIPQEAEAYEARDEAGLMVTRVTEQINLIPKSYPMRELCGNHAASQERYLMLRLGPAEKAQPLDPPATVLVSARRNDTLPEEQVTTNAKGMCFLPDGAELTSCLKITLPDEPGLLPVMVSLKALRQGGTGPVKIGVHGLQKSGQGS
eukprot:g15928.t1